MCYVHLRNDQLGQESILSTEEWIEILQQAIDAGIMHADLTGGECLTHPGFKQIYLYLIARGVKVAILTNGQLLSEKMVAFLSKYPPSVIQITVYGSCNEAYEKVTGKPAFPDVIQGIELAKRAGLNVRLVVTPNRYMQGDEEQLLNVLREIGVRYDIGSASLPPRPETGRAYNNFLMDTAVYAHMLKLDSEHRTAKNPARLPDYPEFKFRVRGMEQVKGLPCAAGTGAFHVNWKGEMTPCIPFYTIAHSVKNGQLMEAWKWISDEVRTYSVAEQCQTCEHRTICKTCTAEKTACVLNGTVNHYVCERLQKLIDLGLIEPSSDDCGYEGEI